MILSLSFASPKRKLNTALQPFLLCLFFYFWGRVGAESHTSPTGRGVCFTTNLSLLYCFGVVVVVVVVEKHKKESEVDSANASGTQALALRGLSNPGVLRLGLVYREAVSRYTFITPP